MNVTIDDVLDEVKRYNDQARDYKLIKKAYDFAKKAHADQKRASGAAFVFHSLSVALILAQKRMDHETICAALLHDVVEDTKITIESLRKEFEEDIVNIVEGVTKVEKVRFTSADDYNAENLRKVLLATSKDARVMILKLADRLDNMKSLDSFREDKKKRIAEETLNIYAPIAHKLGMWGIKGDLEDLAMKYLMPKTYNKLTDEIHEKRDEREKRAKEIMKEIGEKIERMNMAVKISGRAKYFFSIYKKMMEKKKSLEEINDLVALRIIAKTIPDCYTILEIIKGLYTPLPENFDDYIRNPKKNGYQSIHIDVKTEDNKILEIQIRTMEMHHQAEEGVAAHWRYKQTERDKKFDQKIGWLKQILEWKQESSAKEFVEDLKIDLFQDEVVVLTPKSDPLILPEDSTPIDFAYAVHTNIGNLCSKAEVNGKIVPLDYKLKSGDVCRIITQKNARPNRSWLNFVKTSKARSKIRSLLGIIMDKDPKAIRTMSELDKIDTNLVKYLDYDGKRNVKLSKCCHPQLQDSIIGFITKEGVLTVHKKDCPNVHSFDQNKAIPMKWKQEDKTIKTLIISVQDRIGLIHDLLNAAVGTDNQILSINIKTVKLNLLITLKIKSEDGTKLQKFVESVSKISNINSVKIQKKLFPF
ncbi:bifunctional (p)ppGpp synthetase/guanosine-3',5'-bis(diphosphate) 3'-pyrophosphohydrolase [Candidatus Woesearchaeota archaeon]|nr:bifunctional (p)ppGpp synthetase/guanosine-3',5'-bis(diphosphate) 3'-pyrophosphohydrolase [Candidatus Woesearchaeota archaeon]